MSFVFMLFFLLLAGVPTWQMYRIWRSGDLWASKEPCASLVHGYIELEAWRQLIAFAALTAGFALMFVGFWLDVMSRAVHGQPLF